MTRRPCQHMRQEGCDDGYPVGCSQLAKLAHVWCYVANSLCSGSCDWQRLNKYHRVLDKLS